MLNTLRPPTGPLPCVLCALVWMACDKHAGSAEEHAPEPGTPNAVQGPAEPTAVADSPLEGTVSGEPADLPTGALPAQGATAEGADPAPEPGEAAKPGAPAGPSKPAGKPAGGTDDRAKRATRPPSKPAGSTKPGGSTKTGGSTKPARGAVESDKAASARPSTEPAPTDKPAETPPKKKTVVPRTKHVRAAFNAAMQRRLDSDSRMQPWVNHVMQVAEQCFARELAGNPKTGGTIRVRITMHDTARPSPDVQSLPPALSGVVACATGKLAAGRRMPLFTGPEGEKHTIALHFEP